MPGTTEQREEKDQRLTGSCTLDSIKQRLLSETRDFKEITMKILSSWGDMIRLLVERVTLVVLWRMNSKYPIRRN